MSAAEQAWGVGIVACVAGVALLTGHGSLAGAFGGLAVLELAFVAYDRLRRGSAPPA